jgi:hypothetical protein
MFSRLIFTKEGMSLRFMARKLIIGHRRLASIEILFGPPENHVLR